jgi:TM2 domain-containing membrane protein YozV
MLGHIESYSKDVQTGVIKYEDKYLEFYIDAWTSEQPPQAGDDVDFVEEDGVITRVGLVGAYIKDMRPVKRKWIATVLAFLLGCIGAHRFYLGFYRIGVAQICFTAIMVMARFGFGPGVLWGFVEGFLLFTGHIYKDAKGRQLK